MRCSTFSVLLIFLVLTGCYHEDVLDACERDYTIEGKTVTVVLKKEKVFRKVFRHGWKKREWYQVEADLQMDTAYAASVGTIYLDEKDLEIPLEALIDEMRIKFSDDKQLVVLGCRDTLMGFAYFGKKLQVSNKNQHGWLYDSLNVRQELMYAESNERFHILLNKWTTPEMKREERLLVIGRINKIDSLLMDFRDLYEKKQIDFRAYSVHRDSVLKASDALIR